MCEQTEKEELSGTKRENSMSDYPISGRGVASRTWIRINHL